MKIAAFIVLLVIIVLLCYNLIITDAVINLEKAEHARGSYFISAYDRPIHPKRMTWPYWWLRPDAP